jgi:F0F1-type ATP synthase assembly protein I
MMEAIISVLLIGGAVFAEAVKVVLTVLLIVLVILHIRLVHRKLHRAIPAAKLKK